ncbi:RNA binding protein MSSP-2 [Emericellopsis cladophorae]|uniref:RNA binding protein MSSP-2 n=1 Tax=Emericellopsis cladophorae TaxID=2686198 RepID=A0A9Q0BHJ9_9HYPO|nr:RNA binding protein MSSP-2 [Emericellopsis cladophorae]KAI6785181.1 RNA binding protein MSSP-2 [Emericellopsis cladophorae]
MDGSGNNGAFSNTPSGRAVNPAYVHDPSGLIASFGNMNMHGGHHAPLTVSSGNGWLAPMTDPLYHHQQSLAQDHHYAHMPGPGFPGAYYGVPMPAMGMMPYTPGRHVPRLERGYADVPALENRRGSYSTTESTPTTPYWAGFGQREGAIRVASHDRSAYTTPSPQQLGVSVHYEMQKPSVPAISESALEELLVKEPPIPKAVPAVFTPTGQIKSVDQSLENRIPGNRNVYIRGLHPTTDDELLYLFAARFGPVETSKAIIDTGTGACKGFGFAKFFDVRDSEMCIRGFHRLGYEVGFARESFNSRLKAQGDEGSTNLYISNLPKTLTEVELGTIFLGYNILSSKILRDNMGNSRGVGFARFENRDICADIIQKFNGVGIGEEGLLMNIRFADTPAQKELKRVTAERRQFRTNEYNIGAYGTPLVGIANSLHGQHSDWRRNYSTTRSDDSAATRGNGTSASQPDGSRTARSSSEEAAITVTTPDSSECDEGATINADSFAGFDGNASIQSSPSPKKEMKEVIVTTARKET